MTGLQRCLAAVNGDPVDRIPVFPLLMFFAQSRLGVTYRQFATDAGATADAQLNIAQSFAVDAITACTDAFRLTADLGAEMVFPEEGTPFAEHPLVQSEADLNALSVPDPDATGSRMRDRCNAVSKMSAAVGDRLLVLGWIDMPFAEACSICGIAQFMMLLYDNPGLAHQVLEFTTACVIDFALAQCEAGAPMIGAGDAAASLIAPQQYRDFVLPYESRVVEAIHNAGGLVKLHICGDSRGLLPDMASTGADVFNVDHLTPLTMARDVYAPKGLCYKGNLNPVTDMMQACPESCEARCFDCLSTACGTPYMLSPGCEVPAATPDDVFGAFCNAPKAYAGIRGGDA